MLVLRKTQEVLFANTARAMGDAPREVELRHIGNRRQADPAYGKGVADALGIPLDVDVQKPRPGWVMAV